MNKFIGDRKFYRRVLGVAIPIMIQNGITNFVGFLDNIMVGRVGTEQMTGVSITNQLIFVFNLSIFGAISGAGIFTTQFFGQGNHEGVKNTFRFKLIISAIISFLSIGIFSLFGNNLIGMYLHEGNSAGDLSAALCYGREYMLVMMFGLIPFALEQCYSGTLRETGETMLPMKAGIVAVLVNLALNYILIFGKFGAPELGVVGAAIATVMSRIIECAIIVVWTHIHNNKNKFIVGAYRNFHVPIPLTGMIIRKGMPLLANEFLWSAGMAILTQCYSVRGMSVVAGLNISSTITNLFNVFFVAMGSAVAILVGQLLGACKFDEARDTSTKIITLSVVSCIVIGAIMIVTAPLFPMIYNTNGEVKNLATSFIRIMGLVLPIQAYLHAAYFIIRSGGKTFITFLFDSVYVWVIAIPVALCLTRLTNWPIVPIYLGCQLLDLLKCAVGFVMLKKGIWINNIVNDNQQ